MTDKTIEGAINDILKVDPLQQAEDTIGALVGGKVSYKEKSLEGEIVTNLGLHLMADLAAQKRELAALNNDTTYGSKLEEYVKVIKSLGFRKVLELEIPLDPKDHFDLRINDKYFIYVTDDGLVLSFDTYWNQTSVNGATLYFNYASNDPDNRRPDVSFSGGAEAWDPDTNTIRSRRDFKIEYDENYIKTLIDEWGDYWKSNKWTVYVCSVDAREFLRHTVTILRRGRLLSRWAQRPFMWLLHYMDTKCLKCGQDTNDFQPHNRCSCTPQTEGYNYRKITEKRIQMADPILREIVGTNDGE